MTAHIALKRIYEPAAAEDGYRVLVDRLWPRGVRKDAAALDAWMKDLGPSTGLRTWWDHDADRFEEFAERYQGELDGSTDLAVLRAVCANKPRVTLLYAAQDPQVSHALVLRDVLLGT
jgi:uncharacterized protein YeaO (DUF488 family)